MGCFLCFVWTIFVHHLKFILRTVVHEIFYVDKDFILVSFYFSLDGYGAFIQW